MFSPLQQHRQDSIELQGPLYQQVKSELCDHILPFWIDKIDTVHGGYYGYMSHELELDKEYMKGGLATVRLLWTFSKAASVLGDASYRHAADHAYNFLVEHLIDHQNKGIFYATDFKGNPLDTRKHIYIQAFGIYGLSEYYKLTGSRAALNECLELYEVISTKGYDEIHHAYLEEFDSQWNPLSNELLSENGVLADYTYNTHLHILEAFTNLYKVWPNPHLKQQIEQLLETFYTKIYDSSTHFYKVFFNSSWESIIDLKSYGHDIETSWLIDEALKALGTIDTASKWHDMVIKPAYAVLNEAMDPNGGLNYECENGLVRKKKIWWVQSEAFVGYLNAYEKTKDAQFLVAANSIWSFISTYFVDSRVGGEWHSELDENNVPTGLPIVEPWKLNYHNGRCCLELLTRYAPFLS